MNSRIQLSVKLLSDKRADTVCEEIEDLPNVESFSKACPGHEEAATRLVYVAVIRGSSDGNVVALGHILTHPQVDKVEIVAAVTLR